MANLLYQVGVLDGGQLWRRLAIGGMWLALALPAHAQTTVSGTIAADSSWSGVVRVTGTVTVNAGVTLTVEPGTVVKFNASTGLTINGRLEAVGTSAAVIRFTSVKDDTVGGDTNGDGNASSPAAGDWRRIAVAQTGATANLAHADLRYGAQGSNSELLHTGSGASLTLLDSTLSFSNGDGVYIQAGQATLLHNTFSDILHYGVDMGSAAGPTTLLDNQFIRAAVGAYNFFPRVKLTAMRNLAVDCGQANAIRVADSDISATQVWQESLPYVLAGGGTVAQNTTLSLVPGTILKMNPGSSFTVNGTLQAIGTSLKPIVFTSIRDDSFGGDNNNDGDATMPAAGDWRQLLANNFFAQPTVEAEHVVVRYAGNSGRAAVEAGTVSSFAFRHGLIEHALNNGLLVGSINGPVDFTGTRVYAISNYGVQVATTNPTHGIILRDLDIETTGGAGLYLEARANFDLEGVAMLDTGLAGAVLIKSAEAMQGQHQWAGGFTYVMETDLAVALPATLTIGPGAILKFKRYDGIQIDGTLDAVGTPEAPIIFTALTDDTGGDHNEDGSATTPAPGDWFSIWIRDSFQQIVNAARVTLEHVEIRYAGGETPTVATPAILVDGGFHYLHQVLVRDAFDVGFRTRLSQTSRVDIDTLTIRNTVADAFSLGPFNGNGAGSTGSGGGHVAMRNVAIQDIGGDAIVYNPTYASYTIDGFSMDNVLGLKGTRMMRAEIFSQATVGYLGLVVVEGSQQVETGSLTILPGTTLKMRKVEPLFGETVIWARHGPLHANGTAEAPILFTSLHDDSVYGDSNNDGAASQPAAGDWVGVWLSQPSELVHAEIRYAGGDYRTGGLALDGGGHTTSHLLVHEVSGCAVSLGTGVHTVSNCLAFNFGETGFYFSPAFSYPPVSGFKLFNNTVIGGRAGLAISSYAVNSSQVVNNLFTGASEQAISYSLSEPLNLDFRHNCLYNPEAVNGEFATSGGQLNLVGNIGNLYVDPQLAPDSHELEGGSPLIDAAAGDDAPTTDRRGFARFDDPTVPDQGSGTPTFADIGALERLGASDPNFNPDLIVVAGSPTAAPSPPFVVGQTIELTWHIHNQGGSDAPQHRDDAIYLSTDPQWVIDNPLLATFQKTPIGLAAGQTYEAQISARIPPVPVGHYYLVVRTDYLDKTFESRQYNNQGASTQAYEIDVPELPLADTMVDSLTPSDNLRLYKIEISEPLTLDLRIAVQALLGSDLVDIMVRRDALPTLLDHDARATAMPASGEPALLQLPLAQPGTYYVLVTVKAPVALPDNLQITTQLLAFGITQVRPAQVGNVGQTTLLVEGAQFSAATTVELVGPGRSVLAPVATLVTDSSRLAATFDLQGVPTGFYDVVVRKAAATVTAVAAVEVVAAPPVVANALPELDIFAWESLRYTPPGPIPIVLSAHNPYLHDLPILLIFNAQLSNGEFAGLFSVSGKAADAKSQLLLLPFSFTGRPGILAPGETVLITIYYHGVEAQPFADGALNHVFGAIALDDTEMIFADPQYDSFIHLETSRRLGATWATAGQALRAEASRLLLLGQPVMEADKLWRSILDQVGGTGQNSLSGTLVDAITGLPLAAQEVVAAASDGNGFTYHATTSAEGTFEIVGLVNDSYRLVAPAFFVAEPPQVDLVDGSSRIGLIILASPIVEPDTPDGNRLQEPVALQVDGEPHLLFVQNSLIFHTYRSPLGEWQPPLPLPNAVGRELSAVYSNTLLDGQPGLAVFFQQTAGTAPTSGQSVDDLVVSPNDIRIMAAIARADGNGGWEWSEPQVIAAHAEAAFFHPEVELEAAGNPMVAFQAIDFTHPEDDYDLYYLNQPLAPEDFVFPSFRSLVFQLEHELAIENGQVLPAGSLLLLDEQTGLIAAESPAAWEAGTREADDCAGWSSQVMLEFNMTKASRLPDRIPALGGENTIRAFGFASGIANLAAASVQGGVTVQITLFKQKNVPEPRVEATATFLGEGTWTLNRQACEYQLSQFKLAGTIAIVGRFPIPGLYYSVPGLAAEVGLVLGVNPLGGELIWNTATGGNPTGRLLGGATFGFYGSVTFAEFIGGTLTGTGNAVMKYDAQGIGLYDILFKIEGVGKVGPFSRKVTWRFPPTSTFSRTATAGRNGAIPLGSALTLDGFLLEEFAELSPRAGANYNFASHPVQPVLANVAADQVDDTRPRLLQADDGTLWLFWTREPMDLAGPLDNHIVFATFDGLDWSPPSTIPGIAGFNRSLQPALAADGSIVLLFAHADATGIDGTDVQAYVDAFDATDVWSVSFRNGLWTSPLPVAIAPGTANGLASHRLADGTLWATWKEGEINDETLYAAPFNPASGHWNSPTTIARGWLQHGAAVFLEAGLPVAVWAQELADPGQPDLPVADTALFQATFTGSAWSTPEPFATASRGQTREPSQAVAPQRQSLLPLLTLGVTPPFQCCDDDTPAPDPPVLPPMADPRQSGAGGANGLPILTQSARRSSLAGAWDPNDKLGPVGFGAPGHLQADTLFPYVVLFENDPEAGATAPALTVRIVDTLSSHLDPDTFTFVAFGWGSHSVSLPPPAREFQTTVDTSNSDGSPLQVVVSGQFDPDTGSLEVVFASIDPQTGLPPLGTQDGFLLVEDGSGNGQGYISFQAAPRPALPSGTKIANQAEIIFDTNEAILTPTVLRTIDAESPTSAVAPLPPTVDQPQIQLAWNGHDADSGVAWYDLYVAQDGGPFWLWQTATVETTAIFLGTPGHTYAFFSVATDNVGQRETKTASAEAQTEVTVTRLIRLAGDLDFGTLAVGNTAERILTIHNDGNSALTVTGIDYPEGFAGQWSGSIAPGTSQTVDVTFGPAPLGTYQGFLQVQTDATAGDNTLACAGRISNLQQATLNVVAGWNAVALPVAPADATVESVFAAAPEPGLVHEGAVWRWVPADAAGGGGHYRAVAIVQARVGYMIYCPAPASLIVEGSEVDNLLELANGWNLAGPATDSQLPTNEPRLRQPTWRLDPATRQYLPILPSDQLEAGAAYWFNTRQAFDLDLTD